MSAFLKQKGRSWSNAQSTKVDGINFPSKLEASVYSTLKLLVREGHYENLRTQQIIPLIGKLKLKVDFVVFNIKRGVDEAHEAKGRTFQRFATIVQAWPGCAPMDLIIWQGDARRPFIAKIIRGKCD